MLPPVGNTTEEERFVLLKYSANPSLYSNGSKVISKRTNTDDPCMLQCILLFRHITLQLFNNRPNSSQEHICLHFSTTTCHHLNQCHFNRTLMINLTSSLGLNLDYSAKITVSDLLTCITQHHHNPPSG